MRLPARTVLALALAAPLSSVAWGHGGGFIAAGESGRVYQELTEIFGKETAFAAQATLISERRDGKHTEHFPYIYRHGRLRLERRMADNPFLRPWQVDHHRAQGTDEQITLVTEEATYTIFPRLEAYFRLRPRDDLSPAKIVRRELGEETIDGHPCREDEFTVTDETGTTRVLVWKAQDQHGLPIRVRDEHPDQTTTTLELRDVKPDPAAALFEVPTGYVGYDDIKTLLKERTLKP